MGSLQPFYTILSKNASLYVLRLGKFYYPSGVAVSVSGRPRQQTPAGATSLLHNGPPSDILRECDGSGEALLLGKVDSPGLTDDSDLDLSRVLQVFLHGLGHILGKLDGG